MSEKVHIRVVRATHEWTYAHDCIGQEFMAELVDMHDGDHYQAVAPTSEYPDKYYLYFKPSEVEVLDPDRLPFQEPPNA